MAIAITNRDAAEPDTRFRRVALLVLILWLVLLLIMGVGFLQTHPAPIRILLTFSTLLAFVATYLALVLRPFFVGESFTAPERWLRSLLLGLLIVLGLLLYPLFALGIPPWWLVYATIAAGWVLPTRGAAWTVAFVTVLVGVFYWAARGITDLTPLLGVGVMGFSAIVMTRLVATNGELRAARAEIARLAVAAERLRFARDLHDLIGHNLSLITLKSELAGRLVRSAPDRAAAEIADVERVARTALDEVRATVAGYRQPTLDGELAGADELLAAAGIACRIVRADHRPPPALDATLAWVVREGVTNVIRHSHARHCTISIAQAGDTLHATVLDDGRGAAVPATGQGRGNGLVGLAERIAAVGGTLRYPPRQGGGFCLTVAVPLGADDRESAGDRP